MQDRATIVAAMLEAATLAGARILEVARGDLGTCLKADASPVTLADRAAEAAIAQVMGNAVPGIPIVSEENAVSQASVPTGPYFLSDPLDGTRGFVEGGDEYTVNIALIEAGVPTLGVILVPPTGELYWVSADGAAMARRGGTAKVIRTRPAPAEGLAAIVSRTNGVDQAAAFLRKLKIAKSVSASSSLKFCRIAEGVADIYPRFGPTSEWDTAAGDAILRAAGGSVRDQDGAPLGYGKPRWLNGPFVARGQT